MTVTRQPILHQQRHLVRQAQLDRIRQPARLAEVDQVFEREGQRHRLAELDADVQLRLVDVGVAPQRDRPAADVSLAGKLDALLRGLDRN